jgi:hypothetical protein
MNLLETMAEMENGEPFYMVGKRPLHSTGGEKLNKWSPGARHEHFVHSDGVNNFGFAGDGEFSESPSVLGEYSLTDKYGAKRYKASILELAKQNWHANHDAIDDMVERLGMQEELPPSLYRNYNPVANNCQHYVQWITDEYDRLARQ